MPRSNALIVLVAVVVAGCATTTKDTRSAPVLKQTTKIGEGLEDDHAVLSVRPAGDHQVKLVATEVKRCVDNLSDTYAVTVTHDTVVDDSDKSIAKGVGVAGGIAVGVGVVAFVVSPLSFYDPKLKDSTGALVPVQQQQPFALWPIGVAVGALGVLGGVPALLTPLIVSGQETTTASEEDVSKDRTAPRTGCSRDVPLPGEHVVVVVSGNRSDIGTTGTDGALLVDVTALVDDLVPTSGSPGSANIEVSPSGLRGNVTLAMSTDGIDAVELASTTDDSRVRLTTSAFPTLGMWNLGAAQRKIEAEKRAAAEASHQGAAEKLEATRLAAQDEKSHADGDAAVAWAKGFELHWDGTFEPESVHKMPCPRPKGCSINVYRLADDSIDGKWIVMIDTESNMPVGIVTTWKAFRPLDKMMFWWLLSGIKMSRPAEDAFNESAHCQGCKIPVGKLSCWVKLNGSLDDGSFRCMPTEWKTFAMQDLR